MRSQLTCIGGMLVNIKKSFEIIKLMSKFKNKKREVAKNNSKKDREISFQVGKTFGFDKKIKEKYRPKNWTVMTRKSKPPEK